MRNRDREQQLIFSLMRQGVDPITWGNLVAYLNLNQDTAITLADGTTWDFRAAVVRFIELFPDDITTPDKLRYLARSMQTHEFVHINGQQKSRIELYVDAIDVLESRPYITLSESYSELGFCMTADQTVFIPALDNKRMSRKDVFLRALELHTRVGSTAYDPNLLSCIAASMRPDETVHIRPHGRLDRLTLSKLADETIQVKNPHTMMTVAMFSDDLISAIVKFKNAFLFTTEVKNMHTIHEPTGINYDALSIGGEDERRAFIMAVRANDLHAFADSAFRRRYAENQEGAQKRSSSSSSSNSKSKRARRKSTK